MNRYFKMRIVAVAAAVAFSFVGTTLFGADKKDDGKGWISMFDGTTLDGWKANELPDQWKVIDGCIVAHGERSHLFYVGTDPEHPADFKNFDFKAEVMTTPGSNSGVYFHTHDEKQDWPRFGYECQVDNSHTDKVRTASLYNVVKNYDPPAKDDTWFLLEISVNGKNIVTKVDGKVIVDYTEPEGDIKGNTKLSHGTFALQAHDPKSTVKYKNLMVKPKKGK